MALKKEFLPLELIELVNISMKTQHTIQSGILMATVIDYLAFIDKHKHSDTCAESIVGKKELTKFVECQFGGYISSVNHYLERSNKKSNMDLMNLLLAIL